MNPNTNKGFLLAETLARVSVALKARRTARDRAMAGMIDATLAHVGTLASGWTPLNDRLVFQPLDGVSAALTDADYEFLADAAKDSE